MQTRVVLTCLPLTRSGQNYLARHSEKGKRADRGKGGKTSYHQGMDRHGFFKSQRAVENREEEMEETGWEVICSAPTTLMVKG